MLSWGNMNMFDYQHRYTEAETLDPEAETLDPEAETLDPEAETLDPSSFRTDPSVCLSLHQSISTIRPSI